jgi:hypothetical protein
MRGPAYAPRRYRSLACDPPREYGEFTVRAWASLWLLPLAVLGGIALVSLASLTGDLLAVAWGFVVFPHGARYVLTGPRGRGHQSGERCDDIDVHYWRTTLR